MPLTVLTYAYYQTRTFSSANDEYHAHKFVHAIKGHDINGYAWLPVVGRKSPVKFDNEKKGRVVTWFASMAAEQIEQRIAPPRILIPIPNSPCTVGGPAPRTAVIANAITRFLPEALVSDGLRWITAATPSNQGGTRVAPALFANLTCVLNPVPGNVVLIDDVVTSGGHMAAASAVLRSKGMEVALGIAAGRTTQVPVDSYFGWVQTEHEDFDPI